MKRNLQSVRWRCFATDLEEIAKVEMMPKLDGKKMNMMLAPKGKK